MRLIQIEQKLANFKKNLILTVSVKVIDIGIEMRQLNRIIYCPLAT